MSKVLEGFLKEIDRKWLCWKMYKMQTHGQNIGQKEEKKALEYLFEISDGDAEYAAEILEHAMKEDAKRFYKIPREENRIESKSPTVSKERVLDSENGTYEYYCITAASGMIEELTLEDICFVRDGLDKFIKEKKGGVR